MNTRSLLDSLLNFICDVKSPWHFERRTGSTARVISKKQKIQLYDAIFVYSTVPSLNAPIRRQDKQTLIRVCVLTL